MFKKLKVLAVVFFVFLSSFSYADDKTDLEKTLNDYVEKRNETIRNHPKNKFPDDFQENPISVEQKVDQYTNTIEGILKEYLYELDAATQSGDAGALFGDSALTTDFSIDSTGKSVEENVYFALISLGYSPESACGIMGNIYAESNFVPTKVEAGSQIGFGLMQWSYGRRTNFEKFIKANGGNFNNAKLQIAFYEKEATTFENSQGGQGWRFAKMFGMAQTKSNSTAGLNKFKTLTNVEQATTLFCRHYEAPGIPRLDKRIAAAYSYYKAFKGRESQGVLSGGINSVTFEEETLYSGTATRNDLIRTILSKKGANYNQNLRDTGSNYDSFSFVDRVTKEATGFGSGGRSFTDLKDSLFQRSLFGGIGSNDGTIRFIEVSSYKELSPGDIVANGTRAEFYMGGYMTFGAISPAKGVNYAPNTGPSNMERFNRFFKVVRLIPLSETSLDPTIIKNLSDIQNENGNIQNSTVNPLPTHVIKRPFGLYQDPYTGLTQTYKNILLSTPENASVKASSYGTISEIDSKGFSSYKKWIMIDHGRGVKTVYGNLKTINVNIGDVVNTGNIIGTSNDELIFEVRENNQAVNPNTFVKK